MRHQAFRLPVGVAAAAVSALFVTSIGVAADDDTSDPDNDSTLQSIPVSFGGADPLPTSRTVQHWAGHTTNPVDGVTYHYNMVGVDPATEGSATIGVDIIPVNVNLQGRSYNATESMDALLASPLFNNFNFSSTTATGAGPRARSGGYLSAGNTDVQLLDATMRSQFNKAGTDYHLILGAPTVFDAVTIDVADDKSALMGNLGEIDKVWFQTRVQNLMGRLHLDPTRLAIFLTKNIVLYANHDPAQCCGLGGHGAGHATGGENGPAEGNGNQPIQTFVWSSWFTAGTLPYWVTRDIFGLSHEITSWADDPFNTNTVQPWTSTSAPQYGCSDLLETADPTFGVGFAIGGYHVQDEAFLPWFMRTAPNDVSQPTQHWSPLGGRYTLMGDLNPFPWFHQPAITC